MCVYVCMLTVLCVSRLQQPYRTRYVQSYNHKYQYKHNKKSFPVLYFSSRIPVLLRATPETTKKGGNFTSPCVSPPRQCQGNPPGNRKLGLPAKRTHDAQIHNNKDTSIILSGFSNLLLCLFCFRSGSSGNQQTKLYHTSDREPYKAHPGSVQPGPDSTRQLSFVSVRTEISGPFYPKSNNKNSTNSLSFL